MTTKIAYCLASLAALSLLGLTLTGCGPRQSDSVPVAEVSVGDSGVALVATTNEIGPRDWPAWRGASQLGVATDQNLVTNWSDSKNVLWQANVPGRGHGSPIVIGESVFVPSAIDDSERQVVLAYSLDDGQLRWEQTIHSGNFPAKNEIHKKGSNANGTLASDGKHLFAVFFNSGKIIATAMDMNGDQIWQRDVGAFGSKFGYAPSPVLYESFVIVAADNWGGGYIAALDAATGEIAWRVARGDTSTYSSPLVADIGGREQLVISGCGGVTSYDPATGDKLWHTPCISDATCGTVVTDGKSIFASGGYPDKETVCLSADGEKLWSNRTKVYEPSMIVAGGALYAVSDDGIAYCWDAATGDVNWRERLGGNFSGSPTLCDGLIYTSNLNGETFVFKARADEYEQVAKNKLGTDCYASPAASGGKLLLRIGVGEGRDRRETLVCIGEDGR